MPVVIQELVVRVVVEREPALEKSGRTGDAELGPKDVSKLVEACVRETLKALRRREER